MANEDERHELFIALLGAVDAEDLEVQQQLLNAHPDLLTMSDLEGRTALHRAAGRGVALSLTHLISVSPDLGIANVSVSSLASLAPRKCQPTQRDTAPAGPQPQPSLAPALQRQHRQRAVH